jgi:hypothetical protein
LRGFIGDDDARVWSGHLGSVKAHILALIGR